MKIIPSLFLAASLSVGFITINGCSKSSNPAEIVEPAPDPDPEPPMIEVPLTDYDLTSLSSTDLFLSTPQEVLLEDQTDNELSGIAASHKNPNIHYMHNDSDNSPIIVTNEKAEKLAKIYLDGMHISDPEDISVGPGPDKDKTYIYYGTIGDNNKTKSNITVFRFEEPDLTGVEKGTEVHIAKVDQIKLSYPGTPFNAEALLIDPLTKDIYIATKEVNRSTIYKAAYPQSTTEVTILEPTVQMRFFDLFTSGDISADGKEILLRNRSQIWYWVRNKGASIQETLLTAPKIAPYAGNEHQGEGIGFTADGKGYVTNTESRDYPGAISQLSFYKRK